MSKILLGGFIILLFQSVGMLLNHLFIPILPGSIIGMILLFGALQLRIVREEALDKLVGFMMANMSIFFLPSAVGIMVALPLIGANIVAISLTTIISTVVMLLSVGWCQQWLNRRKK